MNKKANAQKNTLLKNAQANTESNFFKSVFFSPCQNPPLLFLQIYFSHHTSSRCNRTDNASNVSRFGQNVCRLETVVLHVKRTALANNTYKKLAMKLLN